MTIDDILDHFKDLNHVYNDSTKLDLLRNLLIVYTNEIGTGTDNMNELINSYNALQIRHELLKKNFGSLFDLHKELVESIDEKMNDDHNKFLENLKTLETQAKDDWGNCTKKEVYKIALADVALAMGDVI